MEIDNRVDEYLKRIEVDRPKNETDEEYLIKLHIGHLTHIPFETFDLNDFQQLNISPEYTFSQLVQQKRGGVCYHMNGLLAFILKSLNYNVQLIPCNVYGDDINDYVGDGNHLALYVTLNNGEKLLCDVGFSREALTPLFFRTDCIQFATNGFFRLVKTEDGLDYRVERGFLNKDDPIRLTSSSFPRTEIIHICPERIKWMISYKFPINFLEKSLKIEDFQDKCPFILHSPAVILNHCTICHIHTYKPRVGGYSIVGKKYSELVTENGIETRKQHSLSDMTSDELKKLLKEKFNLTIEREIKLIDE
jgi:arylamine N-acetyltransferase